MLRPFNYGKLAEGNYYTDREKESTWLEQQINTGINTMIISPRRWGKSSLVLHTASRMKRKNKKIVFCFIDLYNMRTEQEFAEIFSASLVKATASTLDEIGKTIRSVFKHITPVLSVSPDESTGIEIGFDWKAVKKHISEVLDLANKLAQQKKIQLVVCVDEFQNISFLEEPLSFQKKLRAHWQKHQQVTYVLYGSRQHLMVEFFTKQSMPFYKFGEILFLDKIPEKYWLPFIQKRFKETGKSIAESEAATIASLMKNHPYFVQQLAQVVWQKTKRKATAANIDEAIEDLLDQYTILYQKEADQLTNYQLNFLTALADDVTAFTSKAVLTDYNLGTSANVKRIKEALQNKEIIDVFGKNIFFNDPMFQLWLVKRYFRQKRPAMYN
jgi:uncharacterized protein